MADPTIPPPPADPFAALKAYAARVAMWALNTFAVVGVLLLAAWAAKRFGVDLPIAPPPPVAVAEVPAEKVGPAIAAALDKAKAEPPEVLYFCGSRLARAQRTEPFTAKPWPTGRITWHCDTSGYAGKVLTDAQIREALDVAFKSWAAGVEIDPVQVDTEAAALVRMRFSQIDGQFQILAQSELADGTLRPKQQEYDAAEPWTASSNPSSATIDLVRVAAHELGHVLGLDHAPEGSADLMAPIYSRTVRFPTAHDVERLVQLGYKRRVTTGTPGQPPSPPPPTIQLTVTANPEKLAELLRANGYKVELVGR